MNPTTPATDADRLVAGVDHETASMQMVLRAVRDLPPDAAMRVLAWARERVYDELIRPRGFHNGRGR